MYGGKETLYDVLGVPRDAADRDIARAYRRVKAELESDRTAPDPRRTALLREAYEVLSDPQRRDAYDESLRGPKFLGIPGGHAPRRRWAIAIGVIAAILAGAWYYVARDPEPVGVLHPANDAAQQVHTAASLAIGRVHRIDISGRDTPLGLAIAVEEGVMVTPCEGLTPGAQIVVKIPPRSIPGQILQADEAVGLCRLTMHAGGSWPLPLTSVDPRPADRVYAAHLNAKGEVVLRETKVQRVVPGGASKVVEIAKLTSPPPDGAPLIDVHGRVFAVAKGGQHAMLPAAWVEQVQPSAPRAKPAAPKSEEEPAAEAQDAPSRPRGLRPEDIPPERRERLEKAFRPPPKVPDDL